MYNCSLLNARAIEILKKQYLDYIHNSFKDVLAINPITDAVGWFDDILKRFIHLIDILRECFKMDKTFDKIRGDVCNINILGTSSFISRFNRSSSLSGNIF